MVVTVNVPGVPTVKVVLLGLVMAGKEGEGVGVPWIKSGSGSAVLFTLPIVIKLVPVTLPMM